MKRAFGIFIVLLLVIAVVSCAAYTALWHFTAKNIRVWLAEEWQQAASRHVTIAGDPPVVNGFPGYPTIRWGGRVLTDRADIVVPSLSVRSFFIPHTPIHIVLPEGIYFERADLFDRDVWSLQYLAASGIVPSRLPATADEAAVRAWRDSGGVIDVRNFALRKDTLLLSGNGRLWLDDTLQPAGSLHADVTGYGDFITFLQRKKLIEDGPSFLIVAVLNGLAHTDPETGQRRLTGDLALQDRRLMMGPATLMTLPAIVWPQANMPRQGKR